MGNGQDRDNKQSPSLEDAFGGSGDDALANALLEALGQGKSPTHEARPESTELTLDSSATISEGDEDAAGFDIVAIEPQEAGPGEVNCPTCGDIVPSTNRFCGNCGATLADLGRRQRRSGDPVAANRVELELNVHLVAINEDGSDGIDIPLRYTETIIGREGDTRFPTDAFLSPQHSRILVEGRSLVIEDMYSLNGTYIRIRDEVRLSPGDCFLMGRQVLRFERFEQTITPKARSADGTRYMGSPPPGGQYKILQVGIGGIYQNVYCLPESGAVLGREKGDIVFPRDRFMSSRHAQIYPRDDGHYYLVDLNSSKGTWTKIWDRHSLKHGDLIFLGQQLFRVDAEGID